MTIQDDWAIGSEYYGVGSLPTSNSYNGLTSLPVDSRNFKEALRGTDKWNLLIEGVAKERGVNPLYVKVTMAIESGGRVPSGPNAYDCWGVMQVRKTSSNASRYDWGKMTQTDTDSVKYQINAGIDVILSKVSAGKNEVFETAWRYVGKPSQTSSYYQYSVNYRDTVVGMYEGFGYSAKDKVQIGKGQKWDPTPTGSSGYFTGVEADLQFTNTNVTWASVGAASNAFNNTPAEFVDREAIMQSYVSKKPIHQVEQTGGVPFSGVVEGVAPLHDDDVFPGHRKLTTNRRDYLRIGDSMFVIPPEFISVSTSSDSSAVNVLRQKDPMKFKTGKMKQTISFSLMFNGINQINGYEMKAPSGIGGKWYMDGLRPLIAQFKRMPFLPVKNDYLNYIHNIWGLTLLALNVDTVPNFPHLLKVTLVCSDFNIEPYMGMHTALYDKTIMYPLFRYWYQKQMRMTDSGDFESQVFLEPMKKTSANASTGIELAVLKEDFLMSDFGATAGGGAQPNMPSVEYQEQMYQGFPIPDTLVIKNINAMLSNFVSPVYMDGYAKPSYQYMGSQTTGFRMQCETVDVDAVNAIRLVYERQEELARKYGHKMVAGYLLVNHQFINFFGVKYIMIDHVEVHTIGPDHYAIDISFTAHNANQSSQEKMQGFRPFEAESDAKLRDPEFLKSQLGGVKGKQYVNLITQEMTAEHMMNGMDLYPDMELPTYDDVAKAIDAINATRKYHGLTKLPITGDKFKKLKPAMIGKKPGQVDPDFFIAYRDVATFNETKDLQDDLIRETLMKNFNKNKALVRTASGPAEKPVSDMFNVQDALQRFDKMRSIATNKNNFTKSMSNIGKKGGGGYFIGQPAVGDELFGMMAHDMFRYGKRGRLVRAFPTYCFLIVDEGNWIDAKRIWNNYYGYHAAIDFQVVQEKNNPIHTAFINLSNVYNTLDTKTKVGRDNEKKFTFFEAIKANFVPSINEDALKQKAILTETAKIRAGCRIHLRMGYGSNASELPIAFNGTVMEIGVGPQIQMIAQSDGIELTNPLTVAKDATTSLWTHGATPKRIIQYFLQETNGTLWYSLFGHGRDVMENTYGIEHFGYLAWDGGNGFGTWIKELFGTSVEGYDVMKNVYVGSQEGNNIVASEVDERAGTTKNDSNKVVRKEPSWESSIINTTKEYTRVIANTWTDVESDEIETYKIWLYGKSAWDVFRVLQLSTPNYIVAPHYHNLHSTLFFGLPHWMATTSWFTENPEDIDKPKKYKEFYKPFQQFHVFDTYTDIITNDIKTSSRNLVTAAIPQYTYDDELASTDTVFADPRIKSIMQRTKYVDSTLIQNTWADTLVSIYANTVGNGDNPGERQAKKFACGILKESFEGMYDGELIVIGQGSIKPHDSFYLSDLYTQMMGVAEVGRVVHTFGFDTGFVTSIKPDLPTVITRHSSEGDLEAPFSNETINAIVNKIPFGGAVAYLGIRGFMYHNTVTSSIKLSANASTLMKTARFLTPLASATKNFASIFRAGIVVSSGIPGIGWLTAISTLAVWGGLTYLQNSLLKSWLPKKGVLQIIPLSYRGQPYVAGIDGQETLIPSWYYSDGEGAKDGEKHQQSGTNYATKSAGLGASFHPKLLGVNLKTPVDIPVRITHPVGEVRDGGRYHVGMDIGGKRPGVDGDPVYSIYKGTVAASYESSSYGQVVAIVHEINGTTYMTIYAHLVDGSRRVSVGDKVKTGQQIGQMGNTGRSDGTHLHFEILKAKSNRLPWKSPSDMYNNKNDGIDKYSFDNHFKYWEIMNPYNWLISAQKDNALEHVTDENGIIVVP